MIIPIGKLEYKKGERVFAQNSQFEFVPFEGDEDALAEFVRTNNCRAVVVGVHPYVGPLYDALPEGGLIARFGVGTDSIDRQQVAKKGLVLANTPGTLDQSVAEHTIFLIGALVRHVATLDRAMHTHQWSPATGDELGDLSLGVIGAGGIGVRVARIAHLGFGVQTRVAELMTVQAVADRLDFSEDTLRADLGFSTWTDDLPAVLAESDIVSVHLPLNAHTRGLFNADLFAAFKPGSLFVNTSRGGLVNERDLIAVLRSGHLAGAGLDVFENEPYIPVDADSDLRDLPNVVLTPHVASNTRAANQRMAETVVENVRHWANGALDRVHVVA